MSANSPSRQRPRRNVRGRPALLWLDVLAILLWGVLFLKYWYTEKLYLLIHPNYMGLTVLAGFGLVIIAALRAYTLMSSKQSEGIRHLTLFPPGLSSILLTLVAIVGFAIEPRAFTSPMAIQRGIADGVTITRSQPQAFRSSTAPEARSLVDWVRTLNVYPEPDAYTGQKVKVQGFVTYPPSADISDRYLLITRFIITCCAADVYPVGLPVKLTQSRTAYPVDKWFEVEGQMSTETLAGKRQLTIQAKSLKSIPEPKNPYEY